MMTFTADIVENQKTAFSLIQNAPNVINPTHSSSEYKMKPENGRELRKMREKYKVKAAF